MNRNWMLDWSIVATAAAAGILSWCYLEPSSLRQAALLVFGLTALGYLILAVRRDHRSPVLPSPNGTSRGSVRRGPSWRCGTFTAGPPC